MQIRTTETRDAWVVLQTETQVHRLYVGRLREAEAQRIAVEISAFRPSGGTDADREGVPDELRGIRLASQIT